MRNGYDDLSSTASDDEDLSSLAVPVASILGIKGVLRIRPHGASQKAHVVLRRVDNGGRHGLISFSLFAQKRIEVKPGKEILLAIASEDGTFQDQAVVFEGDAVTDSDLSSDEEDEPQIAPPQVSKHVEEVQPPTPSPVQPTVPPKMRKTWLRKDVEVSPALSTTALPPPIVPLPPSRTSVGIHARPDNVSIPIQTLPQPISFRVTQTQTMPAYGIDQSVQTDAPPPAQRSIDTHTPISSAPSAPPSLSLPYSPTPAKRLHVSTSITQRPVRSLRKERDRSPSPMELDSPRSSSSLSSYRSDSPTESLSADTRPKLPHAPPEGTTRGTARPLVGVQDTAPSISSKVFNSRASVKRERSVSMELESPQSSSSGSTTQLQANLEITDTKSSGHSTPLDSTASIELVRDTAPSSIASSRASTVAPAKRERSLSPMELDSPSNTPPQSPQPRPPSEEPPPLPPLPQLSFSASSIASTAPSTPRLEKGHLAVARGASTSSPLFISHSKVMSESAPSQWSTADKGKGKESKLKPIRNTFVSGGLLKSSLPDSSPSSNISTLATPGAKGETPVVSKAHDNLGSETVKSSLQTQIVSRSGLEVKAAAPLPDSPSVTSSNSSPPLPLPNPTSRPSVIKQEPLPRQPFPLPPRPEQGLAPIHRSSSSLAMPLRSERSLVSHTAIHRTSHKGLDQQSASSSLVPAYDVPQGSRHKRRRKSPPPDPKSLVHIASGPLSNPLSIRPSASASPIRGHQAPAGPPTAPSSLVSPKKPVVVSSTWPRPRSIQVPPSGIQIEKTATYVSGNSQEQSSSHSPTAVAPLVSKAIVPLPEQSTSSSTRSPSSDKLSPDPGSGPVTMLVPRKSKQPAVIVPYSSPSPPSHSVATNTVIAVSDSGLPKSKWKKIGGDDGGANIGGFVASTLNGRGWTEHHSDRPPSTAPSIRGV